MLVWLIPLLACHVFETVAIECVAGEPCAAGGDADTDADADTDDTDDDGPPIVPAKGFVVSLADTSGGGLVVAYDAAGTELGSFEAPGAGPVAYSASIGTAVLAVDTKAYKLDGDTDDGIDLGASIVGVALTDERAWLATSDDVLAVTLSTAEVTRSFQTDPGTVAAIGLGGTEVLATVVRDGGADLFDVSSGSAIERTLGFDDSVARARGVFAGPEGEPYTCSDAGAIYRVADLADGKREPTVFYDGGASDVTECGWDAGDGTWLLVSSSRGVLRLDAQGRGTTIYTPPSGYTLVRGNFH